MAQIAQQDNLFIHVGTTFPQDASDLTDEVKAKLISCFKAGTILDVVFVAEDNDYNCISKCCAADYDGGEWGFDFISKGDVVRFVLSE